MGSKPKQKIETTYQLHLFKFTMYTLTMQSGSHVSQASKSNSYFLLIYCAYHRYISPEKPPSPTVHLCVPAPLSLRRLEELSGPHICFSIDWGEQIIQTPSSNVLGFYLVVKTSSDHLYRRGATVSNHRPHFSLWICLRPLVGDCKTMTMMMLQFYRY